MIVLHNQTYNPKIDYLICKQLVKTLPVGYDEDRIRNCYIDCSQVVEIYEKDLIEIKTFFKQNEILQATSSMIERLYKICTHEYVSINSDIAMVVRGDLRDIAMFVNTVDCHRNKLFQILFLIQCCTKQNSPIIPYRALCNSLFYAIMSNDVLDVQKLLTKLQSRTQKYMVKHSVEEGEVCIQRLYENRDTFLEVTDAMQIGYYGSFARGNANEYSDFDILVVFSDEKNLPLCKRKAIEFWRAKIPIEIDVAVINESNFDSLPRGIKRSVKFI